MRRSLAKFSESEASNHTPPSADFTTTTPELKFSVHTGETDFRLLSRDVRVCPRNGPRPTAARHWSILSYGVDIIELFRQAAIYANRIVKGEKSAELPVQLPIKQRTNPDIR
jgi:hypothetical protein